MANRMIRRITVALLIALVACLLTTTAAEARFFGVVSHVNGVAQVDPIVSPCQAPSAHVHIFFFARNVTACSTLATMESSPTSAYSGLFAPDTGGHVAMTTTQVQADTSGAWIPEMFVNGVRHDPQRMTEYWSNTSIGRRPFVNIPEGAQMIGGEAHATSPPPLYELYWNCGADFTSTWPNSVTPPNCNSTHTLQAHIMMPVCWDGTGLKPTDFLNPGAPPPTGDGPPKFNPCPATFPQQLPHLQEIVHTGLYGAAIKQMTFSSGPYYTLHGDYWQTWHDQAQLAADEQFLRTGVVPHG